MHPSIRGAAQRAAALTAVNVRIASHPYEVTCGACQTLQPPLTLVEALTGALLKRDKQ